jgi:hypothetical protein
VGELLPHDFNSDYDQWVELAGYTALYFALALLGLWLAVCFTLLVMPKSAEADRTFEVGSKYGRGGKEY